jgi:hypothetical protein
MSSRREIGARRGMSGSWSIGGAMILPVRCSEVRCRRRCRCREQEITRHRVRRRPQRARTKTRIQVAVPCFSRVIFTVFEYARSLRLTNISYMGTHLLTKADALESLLLCTSKFYRSHNQDLLFASVNVINGPRSRNSNRSAFRPLPPPTQHYTYFSVVGWCTDFSRVRKKLVSDDRQTSAKP